MGGPPLKNSHLGGGLVNLDQDDTWRLGLLVAPAGAGKTRALQHWARQRAKGQGMRVAWLGLQPEHNLPERLLDDLRTCLGISRQVRASQVMIATMEESIFDIEGEMIDLINDLASTAMPVTIILDNYERIQNNSIQQAIRLLIEYLPLNARLVIASQSEPPLLQPRLRARRQLLELGLVDLQKI